MAGKQNPNKGNTSNEDMLRMAAVVKKLCINPSELKRKYEYKKRG